MTCEKYIVKILFVFITSFQNSHKVHASRPEYLPQERDRFTEFLWPTLAPVPALTPAIKVIYIFFQKVATFLICYLLMYLLRYIIHVQRITKSVPVDNNVFKRVKSLI